jgi:multidrug efflux pump subunit AcrA (membrane-fusion protein)
MKRKLTLIAIVLLLAGCTFNVKPIYNDKEQAKADAAVVRFHSLHNDRKFDDIYARLDDRVRAAQTREQFMTAANQTFDTLGQVRNSTLVQAKVFPSNPIQIKMLYNSKFEKGDAQEWFTWNIYGDDVRLFEYKTTPGWDN